MPRPITITCPTCDGDGEVYVVIGAGLNPETDGPRVCSECHGACTVETTCSICTHGEPATVRTGDPQLPYACEDCAKEFEGEIT